MIEIHKFVINFFVSLDYFCRSLLLGAIGIDISHTTKI